MLMFAYVYQLTTDGAKKMIVSVGLGTNIEEKTKMLCVSVINCSDVLTYNVVISYAILVTFFLVAI